MFESLVFVTKERALARRLVSLPAALAVQVGLLAIFLLHSLLAREVLQPPERAWAALWDRAPRVTLMGGATAPKPRNPAPSTPASTPDDRLKPPAQTPASIRPAISPIAAAEPVADGPVIDGVPKGWTADGGGTLPGPVGEAPRKILLVGATIRPPRLVWQVPPVYPPAARAMGMSGRVVLRVIVDEQGRVEDVEVVSATSPLFIEPAVEAVRRWRYSRPVDMAGQSVACSMAVTVTFALS